MKRNRLSEDRPLPGQMESSRLPVMEEQLRIDIRREETGKVTATKKVHEEDLIVSGPVYSDEVEVERVPLNQYIDTPPQVRHEGDTMIIPVVKEEVVVQTRLVLVEEVRVTRHRREQVVEKPVTLREEEIVVRRSDDGSVS
jgi:uncharacterized protein (TIGR02271 family)